MKEIIEWMDAQERLPESDTTVLVLVPTSRSEPVWPGYHDGDDWQYADGTSVDGPVTHWAEMPAGESTDESAAAPIDPRVRGALQLALNILERDGIRPLRGEAFNDSEVGRIRKALRIVGGRE